MAIAVFALRGFRWVKERSLYYLYLAFTLLAIGFFAHSMTLGYDFLERLSDPHIMPSTTLMDLGFALYYVTSILAYGILVYAYFRNVREASIAVAVFGVMMTSFSPLLESIIIVLLFAIVFAQIIHLSIRSNLSSMVVCGSFATILASNLLVLMSDAGSEDLYVIGKVLQLAAFIVLLALLFDIRRPK